MYIVSCSLSLAKVRYRKSWYLIGIVFANNTHSRKMVYMSNCASIRFIVVCCMKAICDNACVVVLFYFKIGALIITAAQIFTAGVRLFVVVLFVAAARAPSPTMTMDWLALYTQEQGNAGLAAQKMETE